MLKIKDSLEQKVKSHKELVRKARSVEQEIEVMGNCDNMILYNLTYVHLDGTKEIEQGKKITNSIIRG